MSASIGGRGAWFTVGPRGTRTTVGLAGTGLYYTQASSWKGQSNRMGNFARSGLPSLPFPAERVNPEQAADALATLTRRGVSYETRRVAAYTFLSFANDSEGGAEAAHHLIVTFQQKYPNRDVKAAMNEFGEFLQTNINPELKSANEALRKANRPPWVRITVALGIGIFLLATFGDHNPPVQQSSIAPSTPASVSNDMSAATVVRGYCDAHADAPSCTNKATQSPGSPRGGASELDLAQAQRKRHRSKRKQHQHPEDVHVGEIGRLRLHLLADPADSLPLRRLTDLLARPVYPFASSSSVGMTTPEFGSIQAM
jgi:Protein of unknown function (DUF4236)